MIDIIKNRLEKIEVGVVFTAAEFELTAKSPTTVSRTLNAFVEQGYLRKLSKGRFYKPKIGKFGELPPDDYQIVKDLLVEKGKLIGYITGYTAFNEFGLTTQVPFALQVGTYDEKKAIKRGSYWISFIKQRNNITKENIPLLKLLDCLRFFKIIPDTMPDNACKRLLYLLSQLDENKINRVKKLALRYTPQTIALLGAMLETINSQEDTNTLFEMLNPMTTYKLSISNAILANQKKWHIL
jgi:Fe2+ or Zn2+ uptake regulation protein